MVNALTVDVEDWYMTNGLDIDPSEWPKYEDRVVGNTLELVELFDACRVKATFFVLGCVAEKHPGLVTEIARRGHEIASHGSWHRLVTTQTLDQFREDVRRSKTVLERLAGRPVTLYRAPSWSIAPDKFKALQVLQEEGFTCDSSIQPFRSPLSGAAGAPHTPFVPNLDGERIEIKEFPPTVVKWAGLTLPFAGGFYLRAVPYSFIKWALKRVNRERPGMVYVHPWEIDPAQPRVKATPFIRLIQYYGIKRTRRKLVKLLSDFAFQPLGTIIGREDYPEAALSSQGQRREGK